MVTKWGTKRGGVALGRMIPFGVGAAIGGGVNYLGTKSFGAGILKYYGEIKPSDGDLVIISK